MWQWQRNGEEDTGSRHELSLLGDMPTDTTVVSRVTKVMAAYHNCDVASGALGASWAGTTGKR